MNAKAHASKAASLLAVPGGREGPVVRRRSRAACRCRPAEPVGWQRLDLSPASGRVLRERAAGAGVPVDAWLGVMLDFELALEELGSEEAGRGELRRLVGRTPRLFVATPEAQAWRATLLGRRADAAGRDELPEVAIPTRLAGRARGCVDSLLTRAGDWPLARDCELVAFADGRPLADIVRAGFRS